MIQEHIFALPFSESLPREGHVTTFLRELCARGPPAPGAAIVIQLPWFKGGGYPNELVFGVPATLADKSSASAEIHFAPLMW